MAQHSEHSLILQVDGCFLHGLMKERATASNPVIFPRFGQFETIGQVKQATSPNSYPQQKDVDFTESTPL
jgi:hypothetical protein